MPIYELKCDECENVQEVLSKRYEDDIVTELSCEVCEKTTVHRKIMSRPNHIYKGSGFWATDYQKKSGKPERKK
jgi:putative FmdB family regulatory protein